MEMKKWSAEREAVERRKAAERKEGGGGDDDCVFVEERKPVRQKVRCDSSCLLLMHRQMILVT